MSEQASAPTSPARRDRLPVVFGWVSMLQDLGSKMVAPLIPLLLAGPIGAGPVVIGLVDAAGDATASLSKALGGRLADRRRALPLVRAGYSLSSIAKVAIGLATVWPAVLALRLLDRVGKGIRDAPRDLMLAEVSSQRRGRAFGIQQAMDKTGGFLGPLIGAGAYVLVGERIRPVFLIALVPCLASVVVLAVVLDPADEPDRPDPQQVGLASAQPLPWRRLGVLSLHAAAALPAGLLVLRAVDVGLGVTAVLLAFSANRAAIAACSLPAGHISDRYGAGRIVAGGMTLHAAALGVLAGASGPALVVVGLVISGVADAFVRSPSKSYVSALADSGGRGRLLGAHGASTGVAGLVGALAAGVFWSDDGRPALVVAAIVAAIAAATQLAVGRSDADQRSLSRSP